MGFLNRRLGLVLVGVALVLLAIGSELALADVSIGVAPSLVELKATPGGVGGLDLTVSNEGSEPFAVSDSVGVYKDGSGDLSAVDWVSIQPTAFSLLPGQHQVVHAQVSVPAGSVSGGRYAVVNFKTGAADTGGKQVGVSGQLGAPLLITVQADQPLVRLGSLDPLVPVLEADGTLGFWAGLHNQGNVHITSQGGAVDVSGVDGQSTGRLSLPESTAVLPGSLEPLTTDGSLPLTPGASYHARASLNYGGEAPTTADITFSARADLAVTDLAATENTDGGPSLQVGLHNQGELGLLPVLQLTIQDASGQIVQQATPPRPPLVLPGQTAHIQTQLPTKLPAGDYVLMVHATFGGAAADGQAPFRIGTGSAIPPIGLLVPVATVGRPAAEASAQPVRPAATASDTGWLVFGISLVGLAVIVAGVLWLPVLAGFRRRVRRAARSFAEPGTEKNA